MRAEPVDDFVFVPFIDLLLNFFQRKVHDIVMVQLFAGEHFAKAQPQAMEEIYFVARQVGRVRSENLVNFVAVRQVNFKIELRLGIRQLFPGFADLARLLFGVVLGGTADNDGAGLQRGGGAQDTIPEIVGGNDRQADGFPALFGHGKRLRKQMLLDAAKKLVGVEFVFAGGRAPQQAHVKDHDVAATGLDAVQNVAEVVEVEVVADRNQDISRTRTNGLWTQ